MHHQLRFPSLSGTQNEVAGDDYRFLRMRRPPAPPIGTRTVRTVDLFCGCGGISLGIQEACRAKELGFEVPLAIDFEPSAADCYRANFPGANVVTADIASLMQMQMDEPFSREESELAQRVGHVDILVGGPPCQGHSDLNNSTRRNDPKNSLYLFMARAAQLFAPTHVIIENVVGALHDKNRVVQQVATQLEAMGYNVDLGIVDLHSIGVPQTRRRLLVIASRTKKVCVADLTSKYETGPRSVRWAIEDLEDSDPSSLLNQPATSAKDTRERIDYLFDNNLFELPNEQRPPCHRDRKHTYSSVYGRLNWDAPAQTITSGFYSMCMGRYVHPSRRRTLTAHEAARLQFFPDFFDFSTVKSRTSLATIIGNAVPMKLSYVAGLELLDQNEE